MPLMSVFILSVSMRFDTVRYKPIQDFDTFQHAHICVLKSE